MSIEKRTYIRNNFPQWVLSWYHKWEKSSKNQNPIPSLKDGPCAAERYSVRYLIPGKKVLTFSDHLLAVSFRFIPDPAPDPVGPVLSWRYNTLDFACKVVCQKGRCPLWNPLPRNLRFLWILPWLHHLFFSPLNNNTSPNTDYTAAHSLPLNLWWCADFHACSCSCLLYQEYIPKYLNSGLTLAPGLSADLTI